MSYSSLHCNAKILRYQPAKFGHGLYGKNDVVSWNKSVVFSEIRIDVTVHSSVTNNGRNVGEFRLV